MTLEMTTDIAKTKTAKTETAQTGTGQEKVDRLLTAALAEFAQAGLAGARVDAIARSAGMNKRLLYHYVGDKAALFDAALDLAYERILSSPDELHGAEWRLICHGVASGRTDRLPELLSLAGPSGQPPRPAASGEVASALGLRLLAGLLPELADQLLGNEAGSEAGRREALARAQRGQRAPAPKPRLKLRPDLRSGAPTRP